MSPLKLEFCSRIFFLHHYSPWALTCGDVRNSLSTIFYYMTSMIFWAVCPCYIHHWSAVPTTAWIRLTEWTKDTIQPTESMQSLSGATFQTQYTLFPIPVQIIFLLCWTNSILNAFICSKFQFITTLCMDKFSSYSQLIFCQQLQCHVCA